MRKSLLKLLLVASCLLLSATVNAVGMGGINVVSALGQPLKAEIDLMALNPSEKDGLVAHLATPEAYKNAGLEYPFTNKFKFEIQTRASGDSYIKVTSDQSVNDPFLSLLVELSWSSGKLSREYTFLLDPVDYVPAQPALAEVNPVEPTIKSSQSPAPAVTAQAPTAPEVKAAPVEVTPAAPVEVTPAAPLEVTPQELTASSTSPSAAPVENDAKPQRESVAATQPTPVPVTALEEAVPVEVEAQPDKTASPAVASIPANKEWVAIRRGDTLYKVAEKYKLPDMNLERMLVALYRVNEEKFDDKNMNRIRAGKILRLPTHEEYANVTMTDAVKELHAQAADWNAYRQKLASAATPSSHEQGAQQVATGKISSSVSDKAPVAKETATEVLKLSKGEAPGDQAAAGSSGKPVSVEDRKNAAQEDAIAKAKAEKESQARAAMLEKNLQDMKQLATLKSEAAALAQTQKAAPTPPSPSVQVAAVSPVKAKPKTIKTEQSLIDQILGEPLYQIGVVAILLLLGGLGIMLNRRKKNPFDGGLDEDNNNETEIEHIIMPAEPALAASEPMAASVPQSVMHNPESDHVDPISEADLFLNFGRDSQAEEILKDALQSDPNNSQIRLKLLGIYSNRKDTISFSEISRPLKDSGNEDAWRQAVEMGSKIDPDNPMYGGSGSIEDTGSATVKMTAFNTDAGMATPVESPSAIDLDFDGIAATQENKQVKDMEFNISNEGSVESPVSEPVKFPELDNLGANTAQDHSLDSKAGLKEQKPNDESGMTFTLDLPEEITSKPAASASPNPDAGFSGISLNFDDALASPKAVGESVKDEHWQEVATKLDLARAYQEMGDNEGAREILDEVIHEGDAGQRKVAESLLGQLH